MDCAVRRLRRPRRPATDLTTWQVALTSLAESRHDNHLERAKRELLVRTKRRWVLSTIEIMEENKGPYPLEISTMHNDKQANVGDVGHLYRISGMGVDVAPKGVFSIDELSGVLTAHKSVDREAYDLFHIHFDILNKETGLEMDRQLSFNIEVKDINDNAPFFDPGLTADVPENTPEGTALLQLSVTDRDKRNTNNSLITVSIVSQDPPEPKIYVKKMNNIMAQLNFKGCFDYDKVKKYTVNLKARDHGTPVLSSTAVVTINILDRNNHMPTFRAKEYHTEVFESVTKENLLRIAVDDKDTPNTPGWRAEYYFLEGNEGRNYKIETDPVTNEGILSVIKEKDFEQSMRHKLLVAVKNVEAVFFCSGIPPAPDIATITIDVINVNDPPAYEKTSYKVFRVEEEDPGKELLTPKVIDADSNVSEIRHELVEDPAGWMSMDAKTGTITTIKKMDRDSSFVDEKSVYKIVIRATDDGKPPAQCTATVLIHLRDINDNSPRLVNNSMVLCGNKENKVMVRATDKDADPFTGPFTFLLGSDDKELAERWKIQPSFGLEGGLISQMPLPFGNYSVPLRIQDQQNVAGLDTVEVMVCDCGDGDDCIPKEPASTGLGPAGIGLIFLGLLLFLLLILLLKCQCRGKDFQKILTGQDEGNQTLIRYNQEGGGSPCMMNSNMNLQASQRQRDTMRSQGGQSMYWNSNRMNTYQGGSSSRDNRSVGLLSDQYISDHIDRRMDEVDGNLDSLPTYQPHQYAYEGEGSRCQSLDQLSLSNMGDDLMFLNDLGPKFKTLAGVSHQKINGGKNTEF
ncbi:Cadherin-like protein 26 [Liparis tanakae]|uniref:Cadherin-like protein 26 n=1 Tax=Liparis tanakae TaxID=230148 RepID=A0A4Z2FPM9_9TELE|nr:Cadherin-like protein 26 [Liparis tanakae]